MVRVVPDTDFTMKKKWYYFFAYEKFPKNINI